MLFALIILSAIGGAFALYVIVERQGVAGVPLALLRALVWAAVGVLLLNPSLRRLGAAGPTVLLDASRSMTDPTGDARWRAALDTAHAAAGRNGRIVLFGERPAVFREGVAPTDNGSDLLPGLREAGARGGPIVIVSDGLIDDAAALPADLLRSARIVLMPRDPVPDAGVVRFDLPPAVRAGDTAHVAVDIVAEGAGAGDSVTLELVERERPVARARLALGREGLIHADLRFVPAAPVGERELRRYAVRLSGFGADGEPRNNQWQSAAVVTRGAAVTVLSDSPDWDFRWLVRTLTQTSGVPVRGYVRLAPDGPWRDAHTLRPASESAVRGEAAQATLLVVHGTDAGVREALRWGRGASLRWPAARLSTGDWYVVAPDYASPVGDAFAGVPAESLPPLEAIGEAAADSVVVWTGLVAQLDRRGRGRPVVQGVVTGQRRSVLIAGAGLWRWAARGGAAAEAYRALVASMSDWLLEERTAAPGGVLALRDSLSRGSGEFLPRRPSLRAQPGRLEAGLGEPVPIRHSPWLYMTALAALVMEWVLRRRRGLR